MSQPRADHLVQLIDLVSDPAISWHIETGVLLEWNAGAERLYGYTRREASGRCIHDLLKTHSLTPLAHVRKVLETTGTWEGEQRNTTAAGDQIAVESRQQLVRGNGQQVVLETHRELGDRLRAGEEPTGRNVALQPKASAAAVVGSGPAGSAPGVIEGRTSALLAHLPGSAIFVVDQDLRYTFAAGEALQDAGMVPGDLIGRRVPEAFGGTSTFEADYRQVLQGIPFEREHESFGRVYVSRGTPLIGAGGKVEEALVVSYDVTDQRASETLMRKAADWTAYRTLLNDVLRPLTAPEQVQTEAARVLAGYLDAARTCYLDVDEADGTFSIACELARAEVSPLRGVHPLSELGWLLDELRQSPSLIIPDTAGLDTASQESEPGLLEPLMLRSLMAIPVRREHQLVAVLVVSDTTPRPWSLNDLEVVRETAERTWGAVARTRAEAALRESEARLRALVTQAAAGIVETDLEGRVAAVNPRFCDIVGRSERELIGTRLLEITLPEDRMANTFRARQAVDGVVGFPIEKRYLRGDGSVVWVRSDVAVLRGGDDHPRALVEVSQDISVEKATEGVLVEAAARDAFRLRFADALRPLSDPSAIQFEAARLLGEHLNAHRVFYAELDPGSGQLITERDYTAGCRSLASQAEMLSLGTAFVASTQAGDMVVADDIATDPRLSGEERAVYAALDVGAALVVPLIAESRLVGLFTVHQKTARRWTSPEVTLVEETAERTWAALKKARAEAAVRESEARYQLFLGLSVEGIWRFDLDHPISTALPAEVQVEAIWRGAWLAECNVAMARMYGYSRPEELVGRRLTDFLVAEEPANGRYLHAFIRSGYRLDNFESRETDRYGVQRVFENSLTGQLQLDRGGQPCVFRAWGTQRDVTRQRVAEAALRDSEARQSFLLRLGDALRPLADPTEVRTEAMRMLGEQLRPGGVQYFEVETDESHVRWSSPCSDGVAPLSGRFRIEDLGVFVAEDLRAGRTVVVDDVSTDSRLSEASRAVYRRAEVGSYAAVPLIKKGRLRAVLGMHALGPRVWTAAEIALVVETAERTWAEAERARAEGAVRESEARFRSAFASNMVPMGIWRENFIVDANEALLDLIGYTRADLASGSLSWSKVTPAEHQWRDEQAMREVHETGACTPYEKECIHKRGHRVPVVIGASVFHPGGDTGIFFALDVTDRKRSEQILRENDRRKDEFLAMLAHELRNPLAAVRSSAQVLKLLGGDDPRQRRAREVIERQTSHLSRLVDDLLDVSRITQGRVRLQMAAVSLAEVVARAVEAARPLIDKRRHTLRVDLPETSPSVSGDLTRLVQVVGNLLNNASKYTDPGGEIGLEVRQLGDYALVRVRDNGMGIAPDLLPHVFDLFTQADRALDRSQGGLGIGLTLVRQLVELHGGTVEARSEGLGRGSEFVIRLPVLKRAGLPTVANGSHGTSSARALRVLVVEDLADAAEMLLLLLEWAGHTVRTAANGFEALELASSFQPDVVICDIGLPGMNGYDLARRLRKQPQFASTPLIALSGYGQPDDRRRSADAGFDHHLTKPVEPDSLEELLHSLRFAG